MAAEAARVTSVAIRPVTGGFVVLVTKQVTAPVSFQTLQQYGGPAVTLRDVTEEHVCADNAALSKLLAYLWPSPPDQVQQLAAMFPA